jgi:hypothetical protein
MKQTFQEPGQTSSHRQKKIKKKTERIAFQKSRMRSNETTQQAHAGHPRHSSPCFCPTLAKREHQMGILMSILCLECTYLVPYVCAGTLNAEWGPLLTRVCFGLVYSVSVIMSMAALAIVRRRRLFRLCLWGSFECVRLLAWITTIFVVAEMPIVGPYLLLASVCYIPLIVARCIIVIQLVLQEADHPSALYVVDDLEPVTRQQSTRHPPSVSYPISVDSAPGIDSNRPPAWNPWNQSDCAICLDPFDSVALDSTSKPVLAMLSPCGHVFHSPCIDSYFVSKQQDHIEASPFSFRCCLCRAVVRRGWTCSCP